MQNKKKEFIGQVVGDKMDKTVVVAIDRMVQDPRYKKFIRRTSKFKAHDEKNECHVGDRVKLIETRPLSREKRWVVIEVLERANEV
ncbi:MAG: 30S ribosomal protein S17 [Nitrospirae bacterium]|nr:30S ribosomal protein S17 [Candidatus Manganitrophaceae bacterium]